MDIIVAITGILLVPLCTVVETRLETARFTNNAGIGEVVVDLASITLTGNTEAEAWMGFLDLPRHNRVEAVYLLASKEVRISTRGGLRVGLVD